MKVSRLGREHPEEVAVRVFLWIGLLTTLSCAGLAALAVTRMVTF